ncbi:hypothetical protein N836_24810 [Leptolyngbya sp. Heron Island J]|nr:hypothetical protein N836_24810 [Leptolyngbya sp. Heron Island J]
MTSLNVSATEAAETKGIALEQRVNHLATQTMDQALTLWTQYQPVATDKTQAIWQLLRNTQPVHLLLAAALAVLSIGLVTLVNTFGGLIILLLKLTALGLSAIAVGQWVVRGFNWADEKLPSAKETNL